MEVETKCNAVGWLQRRAATAFQGCMPCVLVAREAHTSNGLLRRFALAAESLINEMTDPDLRE